ncbi:MAG TPA: bacteriohemerythrin, partial [Rhodospirillales bacterium]|nr:bacteriohemerythrin [Rhodospirillales bacterium]
PNILFNLMALGIGVNEIEGIFLTHSHDDHFAGLASLMRSDHRIKCYATPLVRASVAKKLSALLSIEEDSLDHYFDSRDIQFNVWNDIGGLEVLPIFSPHPVETSCLFFRAQGGEGYKTYAHLADIASLKVLEGMITQSGAKPGVSRDLFEKVKIDYLMPADLKKIDIGGGLIHGEAEDFREDRSKKIILSHASKKLTVKQKEIGSAAAFGAMDVLMEGRYDHAILKAQGFIKSYFPSTPDEQSNILLNNPVMTFKPEAILARKGEHAPFIYLVLTGNVERIDGETGVQRLLSAGALIGELSGLLGHPMPETFRAASYVHALRIKCELYLEFVQRNNLFDEISQLQINRGFLQATSLFGESISYPIQNLIAKEMTLMRHDKGAELAKNQTSIFIMKSGAVERFIGEDVLETMTQGDFFGEEFAAFGTPSVYGLRATEPTEIFAIPGAAVKDIPLVRWKLFEAFERRMRAITALDAQGDLLFQWRDEYGVNIQEMDRQHHKLFDMANNLLRLMKSEKNKDDLEDALTYLLEFTKAHFESEENLMKLYGFPGLKPQKAKHVRLMKKADEIKTLLSAGGAEANEEFIVFLKDWVVGHILAEDKKYGSFLNKKGVY